MGRARPKWAQVERYLNRNRYEIHGSGGDKVIVAPVGTAKETRTRNTVRIGHRCCSKAGDEVWPCYTGALRRAFGISLDDLVNS